jgi:hypothetical protein
MINIGLVREPRKPDKFQLIYYVNLNWSLCGG